MCVVNRQPANCLLTLYVRLCVFSYPAGITVCSISRHFSRTPTVPSTRSSTRASTKTFAKVNAKRTFQEHAVDTEACSTTRRYNIYSTLPAVAAATLTKFPVLQHCVFWLVLVDAHKLYSMHCSGKSPPQHQQLMTVSRPL